MAKPSSNYKTSRKYIAIREDTLKDLTMIYEDPKAPGQLKYGVLTNLVNYMLRQHLVEKKVLGKEQLESLVIPED